MAILPKRGRRSSGSWWRVYARKRAVEMIGSAVVEEIWAMLHERKPFDRARFSALLEQVS